MRGLAVDLGGSHATCAVVEDPGAVSMVHAWDPEILVVGGDVMRHAAAVLPAIEERVHRQAWTPWGRVELRAAALGEEAALLGAPPLLSGEARGR
jgi:glucokinase